MTKSKYWMGRLLFVIALAGCLAACGGQPTRDPAPSDLATPPSTQEVPSSPEPDSIARQIEQMTLEEKVGQMLVAGAEETTPGGDAAEAIQGLQVGGIILFKRNVESLSQLAEFTNE